MQMLTTKFILILHLCTFDGEPKCLTEKLMPYQFKDFYSCLKTGYKTAYESLDTFKIKEINDRKIAIKIECKELQGA